MPVITRDVDQGTTQQEVIYGENERRAGVERRREPSKDEKVTVATMTGGAGLEVIGGGAAVVLAIIGLAGYLPMYMTAIATIAIGGGLLAHGAAAAARWNDTMQRAAADRNERVGVTSGLGAEVFGGAGAIALGILALAGVIPMTLLAVSAIVVGGAILIGAPAQPDIARLASDPNRRFDRVSYEAVEGTSGAMALAGVGAAVLGILALLGVGPVLTLVLVSMLAVGGAMFLGGSALTARFARTLHAT
jgi:hypothetical protein